MKRILILAAVLFLSEQAFSQFNNTISVVYGTASNEYNINGAIGDFGYTGEGSRSFGIGYEHTFTKWLTLQTGVMSADDKLLFSYIVGGKGTFYENEEIKLITVPVIARINFLRYLFVDGGLLFDFQTNTPEVSNTQKQTGVGFEIGLGARYSWKHLSIFINPYAQYHAVDTYRHTVNTFNLYDGGYKFGLGYNF